MAHNRLYSSFLFLFIASLSLALISCNSDNTGTLNLSITDAPVDEAENVFIQISALEIHGPGNENVVTTFTPPKQIDLLAMQGGTVATLLENVTMDATNYQWIRLTIDTEADLDSYIVVNGANHELSIPSADQSGLRLVSGFSIPDNGELNLTIDFDLRKSIHTRMNGNSMTMQYVMKPTLRLIDNANSGKLSGTVASGLLADQTCTAGNYVYIYEGENAALTDLNENNTGPLTTAPVVFDADLSVYNYQSDFLPSGNYTIALTCQGDSDVPDSPDNILFINSANILIEVNTTTTHNFE